MWAWPDREYRDQILECNGHSRKVCRKNGDVNRSDFRFKAGNHRTVIKAIRFDTYDICNMVLYDIMIHTLHIVLYHTLFIYVNHHNFWLVVVNSGEEHCTPM